MKSRMRPTRKYTIKDALDIAERHIKRMEGFELPALQARLLLSSITNLRTDQINLHEDRRITNDELEKINQFLSLKHPVPVPFYLGYTEVAGLKVAVSYDTLLPGTETPIMVKTIIDQIKGMYSPVFVDIGTGCGVIAIAVAANIPGVQVYATDLSPNALLIAEKNLELHNLQDRVSLVAGNWLEPLFKMSLQSKVDVLAANPPYICSQDIESLPAGFANFAPRIAIDGGEDGCDGYRAILATSQLFLKKGTGLLILQTDNNRASVVADLLDTTGYYDNISFILGSDNSPRIVVAKMK